MLSEMGRWGDGEMERWRDGERGRWGGGSNENQQVSRKIEFDYSPK
jgi:hypothetical protein